MLKSLKSALVALFDRKKQLDQPKLIVASPDNSKLHVERCQRILNYWLDSELFDLPECPFDSKKQIISEPDEKFVGLWGILANKKVQEKKLKITAKSRLLIMFQCHQAGYIATSNEKHPNFKIPRSYLVAQAMIPAWDETLEKIVWSRSEEDQDLVVNLAIMRTLYRRCRASVPANMSLSDWIFARMEDIERLLANGLMPEEDAPLTTEELQERLIGINRELASQFWPDATACEFMLEQCQPIDSGFAIDKFDQPYPLDNGDVNFRWRFCYYPDENEAKQLGPFFVQDLEYVLRCIEQHKLDGISAPLQAYLLGESQQVEIGKAVNSGDFFWPLTSNLIHGRWPEDPQHGLTLLQTLAVNVTKNSKDNSIVAVNGPPGTGKTTLLKDIIADKFVVRTRKLIDLYEANEWSSSDEWLKSDELIQLVMQHSMVVASSNNKAVENISRELPSFSKLPEQFSSRVLHFRDVADEGDWGLFCAVLGKASNRTKFKDVLKRLDTHIKNVNDIFGLNEFIKQLNRNGAAGVKDVFNAFALNWKNNTQLSHFVRDIKKCQANIKYSDFFGRFAGDLLLIEQQKLNVEEFALHWSKLDEKEWEYALEALTKFKAQWFAKKLFNAHINSNFQQAKTRFEQTYAKINALTCDGGAEWKMDPKAHLMNPASYKQWDDESEQQAEHRIQLSTPLGSEVLNLRRSELFIHALSLNQAILECAFSQLAGQWDLLAQLIDGRLESNEVTPKHQQLWAILFLFFPVVSTSLSSAENQFKLMRKAGAFGLLMIDEAGQAINYHVVGLLQRSRQAIFVGDPIQLEPVVETPLSIDLTIAEDFICVSKTDGEHCWGDEYLVSTTSAQTLADRAGRYLAKIGERKVGIPLLVHRRCSEPMFSIANKIAYGNRMVLASSPYKWPAIQSGWINVLEEASHIKNQGYANNTEAKIALDLVKYLVEEQPKMAEGGIYIITPFTLMSKELKNVWGDQLKDESNHTWMKKALGKANQQKDVKGFADDNIGTVHAFQGKEASTVIICTAASRARKKDGGISWVNSKPNLLNVAVTRAKHHLFVVGNAEDWGKGKLSCELLQDGMSFYYSLDDFKISSAALYEQGKYSAT